MSDLLYHITLSRVYFISIHPVKKELILFDFSEDVEDWITKLELDKAGRVKNTLDNLLLILRNDMNLRNIAYNEMSESIEITGKVPWEKHTKYWRDADDSHLVSYLNEHYTLFSDRIYRIAFSKVVDDRHYHPIKEYFKNLNKWDGVERVDTLLIDYFNANDSEYTRLVTRKTLCAAIARIMKPGIKFDNILVLNGPQGVGKSTLIQKLGRDWYSDSLALSDMNDKTAAEKVQGYWIHEIGELAGMKKADIDKVKAFISRQDDIYRASFGRHVRHHERQCIFFGTTNSQDGFLRDITGNRRFWAVKAPGDGKKKPWDLTEAVVDQIWAEAYVYYKRGETLHLNEEADKVAQMIQVESMEHDDREGVVRSYLEMLLPDDWDNKSLFERKNYVNGFDDIYQPAGTKKRTMVCNLEIWCECFGKDKGDMSRFDSDKIKAIMLRIGNWERCEKSERLPIYGKQRVYRLKED